MMSEPIEPALTPEEWQSAMEQWRTGTVDVEDLLGLSSNNQSTRKQQHAGAALCLYGQKFGFRREDVEALADAIYTIHGPKMDALHPGVEQMLESIRERIEALLPPEA